MTPDGQKNRKPKNPEGKNARGITIPDLKIYYRAIVIKPMWHWHKNRHVNQWNKIKDQHTSTHNSSYLIFDKEAKNICRKKESIFNIQFWGNWISTCKKKKKKLDPHLSLCTKINST